MAVDSVDSTPERNVFSISKVRRFEKSVFVFIGPEGHGKAASRHQNLIINPGKFGM
jgi:hypothetical protein